MNLKEPLRAPEEVQELLKEAVELQHGRGAHDYDVLSYQQGVRAAIMWLFFKTSTYPFDVEVSKPFQAPAIEDGRDYIDGYEA